MLLLCLSFYMESYYFYLFVLPLGFVVFLLALLVYYYARKEEIAQKKLKRVVLTYVRKRVKQKELLNQELGRLSELFQKKSIDEITYERLKKVLDNSYEKEREEAVEQLVRAKGMIRP